MRVLCVGLCLYTLLSDLVIGMKTSLIDPFGDTHVIAHQIIEIFTKRLEEVSAEIGNYDYKTYLTNVDLANGSRNHDIEMMHKRAMELREETRLSTLVLNKLLEGR